jgi:rSAM/selenodomain-associated transferase 2
MTEADSALPAAATDGPAIAIVIPTLNEQARIGTLLADLAAASAEAGPAPEIVVADGGSSDATCAIAEAAGARVIAAPAGRGRQLRAGAAAAGGEVLWLLHADTRTPPGSLRAIADTLGDPAVIGGNFRLIFDGGDRFSRWLTGFYAWFRRRGLYYGDSGMFVRRAVYDRVGGIRPVALMEDLDFCRRLQRAGPTVCIADPPLVTSARRFRGKHPVRIVAGWLWLHALYYLGTPPDALARRYYGDR